MPTYETLFITPPTLSDEDERATVETLAAIVTDGGGSFTANERMGRRRLAYSIRKFEDGVYTRFLYDSAVEIPKELERRIRLSDNVLRSLTVRMEENWAEASKVQAVKDAERRAADAIRMAEEEAARAVAEEAKAAEEAAKAAAAPAEEPEPAAEAAEGSTDAADTPAEEAAAPAEEAAASVEEAKAPAEEAPAEPEATKEGKE